MTSIGRIGAAAIVGAVGAASFVALHSRNAGLLFEMDAAAPPFIEGLYAPERDAAGTFAWTMREAAVRLDGLDRAARWSCSVRFRGPRPASEPLPTVEVLIDDRRAASVAATGEYHDLGFTIPASADSGAHIVLRASPTFVPGGGDPRDLGIQIDRLGCRPSATVVWPPRPALAAAAGAAAVLGVAVAVAGLSLAAVFAAAGVAGISIAVMLTTAGGAYGDYPTSVIWLALWMGALTVVSARGPSIWMRMPLSVAARAVVAVSAVALFVKILGLLHPAKPIIDAVFHAHRLEAVAAGGYFFTQPFVGGVQMPYAIALYVFATPWTWVFDDHVAVIRLVTAAADVFAGLLLYPMVLRAGLDRRTAVLAVLFYQLAPLPFAMLGNANLTNLFGVSMSLIVVAAAVTWPLDVRRPVALAAFTGLVAWAFCSHVGTVTTLSAMLGGLVVLSFWRGDSSRRRAAVAITIATAAALVLSWLVYYRNFAEVLAAAFGRMFSGSPAEHIPTAAEAAYVSLTPTERVVDLTLQAIAGAGWPLVLLAAIGAWSLWRRHQRDRLVSALIAWAAVWLVFSASTVFAPVDQEYVRYAAEFLGRINLATIPLVAILAARGAAAGWDDAVPSSTRSLLRAAAVVLISWALWLAGKAWIGWFHR